MSINNVWSVKEKTDLA